MARTNPHHDWPETETGAPKSNGAEWESLRNELVALLDQVEDHVASAQPAAEAAPLAQPASAAPAPSLPPSAPINRGPSGGGGGPSALRVEAPRPVVTEAVAAQPAAPQPQAALATVASYKELIALAGAKRDVLVKLALESQMRPVSFEQGRIEVALADGADPGMIATLSARLQLWTGQRWLVNVSSKPPEGLTVRQEVEQRQQAAQAAAHDDPLVKAILDTFPGAKVVNVKVRDDAAAVEPDLPPPPPEEDDE